MRRVVGISLLACAAAACGAKTRGSTNIGGGERGCLPAAGAASYRLVTVDGRTHVCNERNVADGGPAHHACWLVDLERAAVRPSDVVVEPGRLRAVPAEWAEEGLCAEGYCVKDPPVVGRGFGGGGMTPETEARLLAAPEQVQLAIGENIAIMITEGAPPSGADFYLFDAQKRLRPHAGTDAAAAAALVPVEEPPPAPNVSEGLIVDDTIFLASYDAGPHAEMYVYASDGGRLGPVTDPADTEEYSGDFELWNGSVSVLGDHEVAFAEHLLQRVLVFDTRAKKVTRVWRRQSATPETCTPEMKNIYFDAVEVNLEFALEEGRVTEPCKLTLDAVEGRFGPYGLARNSAGAFVALARTGDTMVLVTFDSDGDIANETPLGVCDPPAESRAIEQ